MKFSVLYNNTFKYLDKVDEVIIPYTRNNFIEIAEKLKETQRVVIDTDYQDITEEEMALLRKLKSVHENMAVRGDFSNQGREILAAAHIPYFLSNYCKSIAEVYAQIQQGCSDVYIVEGLGFSLKQVSSYCKNNKVNIRVIPNMAQHPVGYKMDIPDPCKFFIRPEDLELYEDYVDICELMAPSDKLSTYFYIYKTGRWLGDLKDLIIGLDEHIYNTGLAPQFGMTRLNCGHKCMLEQCRLCPELQKIAENFEALELEIKKTDIDRDWRIDELKINKETV